MQTLKLESFLKIYCKYKFKHFCDGKFNGETADKSNDMKRCEFYDSNLGCLHPKHPKNWTKDDRKH